MKERVFGGERMTEYERGYQRALEDINRPMCVVAKKWSPSSCHTKLVEYAPIIHGRWVPVDEKQDAFDCSECDAMVQRRYNFCPKCGAKMDL